jgi:hypothetical protein
MTVLLNTEPPSFITREQIDCDEKCADIENTARSAYCYLKCVSESTKVPGWLDPWIVDPGHSVIAAKSKKAPREFERPDNTVDEYALDIECSKQCKHFITKSTTRYYWCHLNCVHSKYYTWPYGVVVGTRPDPNSKNHDLVANFASDNIQNARDWNDAKDEDVILPAIKPYSPNYQIDCDKKCASISETTYSASCYMKCLSDNNQALASWFLPEQRISSFSWDRNKEEDQRKRGENTAASIDLLTFELIDCDKKCGSIENKARSVYCFLKCTSHNNMKIKDFTLLPGVTSTAHVVESNLFKEVGNEKVGQNSSVLAQQEQEPFELKALHGLDRECFDECKGLIFKWSTMYNVCYLNCISRKNSLQKFAGTDAPLLGRANDAFVDSDTALLSWSNKKKVDDQNIDTSGDDSTTEPPSFITREQIDCDEKCAGNENTARSAYCYLKCVSENTKVPGWLDPWIVDPGHSVIAAKSKVLQEQEEALNHVFTKSDYSAYIDCILEQCGGLSNYQFLQCADKCRISITTKSSSNSTHLEQKKNLRTST